MAPARQAAYRALRAVSTGRATLPQSLATGRRDLADQRDRDLLVEIVTGVLRWQGELDHVIARVAGRPATRLDPEVLDILRLAAYQILHLDRIPARAAVDDAVELARAAGRGRASGLVNAVLRAIAGSAGDWLPPRPGAGHGTLVGPARTAALDYLAIARSHPRWLVERWLDRLGFNRAEAWTAFNNAPAPLTIRVNRLRIDAETLVRRLADHGVRVEPSRFAPHSFHAIEGNPLATPLAGEGVFCVQDEASQLVAAFAGAAPGETVLDTCAAPGGKTLVLLDGVRPDGFVVATDLRPRRVALMRRMLQAAGASRVAVVRLDLSAPLPFPDRFDCVLVDAPCSGLGVIRRDPEIRWRRSEADLAGFASRQQTILSHASEGVGPGGRLVYATCSSEPEENESVVDAFLSDHADFAQVDPRGRPGAPPWLGALLDDRGILRSEPDRHGLEAFFAAMLQRRPDGGDDWRFRSTS